VVGEEMHVSIV